MSSQPFERAHPCESPAVAGGAQTPLIEIPMRGFPEVRVLAKCEFHLPTATHKYRVYSYMLSRLLADGIVEPGTTVVDSSSGNGGIALAYAAKERELHACIVTPATVVREKLDEIRRLGGQLHTVPPSAPYGYLGPDDLLRARLKASRIAQENGHHFLDQTNNPLNAEACQAIGREILAQLRGEVPRVLLCGIGTGGALTGMASVMKRAHQGMRVIGVEPGESSTVRARLFNRQSTHFAHRLSGLGAGEISSALDISLLDDCVGISERHWLEAIEHLSDLGFQVGKSSAATFAAALMKAREGEKGLFVVPFFDPLSRYGSEMRNGGIRPVRLAAERTEPTSPRIHDSNESRFESGVAMTIIWPDERCEPILDRRHMHSALEAADKADVQSLSVALDSTLGHAPLDCLRDALAPTRFAALDFQVESPPNDVELEEEPKPLRATIKRIYSTIPEVLEAVRLGKPVLVLDEREEEGDLVVASDRVSPETVNFMLKYGRGVLCIAMRPERFRELGIGSASAFSTGYNETPFGESVDYLVGTTTGVSAFDRSRTIRALGRYDTKPGELRRNGHVRTLEAHPGGLRNRQGHTEATVALAGLAGLSPAGALIEVLADDGSMAREPVLAQFAHRFSCPMIRVRHILDHIIELDRRSCI